MPDAPGVQYAPLDPSRDLSTVGRLLHLAFAGPADKCELWAKDVGLDNIRVARPLGAGPDPAPPACLARIPMGQFFGGRSVPMIGIAGVAVAPEARGGGLALGMMRACVREVWREGAALSCLYASTQALYRQVGFEQAGHLFRVGARIERLGVRERELAVRPLSEADEPAVRAVYQAFAKTTDGMLDRGDYAWQRTRKFRDESYEGFGVFAPESDGSVLEGYLFLAQVRDAQSGRHSIALSDAAFSTARAGRRLLTLLGDFGTMGDEVEFFGGPNHPFVTLVPQQVFRMSFKDHWMLRIVRVKEALEARGFGPGARFDGTLALTDGLLPDNAGMWRLGIADGQAHAEKISDDADGDDQSVRLDVQALASLYAGFVTPGQARLLGWLHGSSAAVAALASAFPGGTPTMSDRF